MAPEKISFEEIYQDNFARIEKYLARTVGSDEAQDLAQEVFLKVFASMDKFENRSSAYTWIFRIATNHLIDRSRKNKLVANKCDLTDKELFSKPEAEYLTEEFRLVQKEMRECICSYIKMLPTRYRAIIALREYESMSLEEISRVMQITEPNAKKLLSRARSRLKALLKKQCNFYYNELNQFSCEQK